MDTDNEKGELLRRLVRDGGDGERYMRLGDEDSADLEWEVAKRHANAIHEILKDDCPRTSPDKQKHQEAYQARPDQEKQTHPGVSSQGTVEDNLALLTGRISTDFDWPRVAILSSRALNYLQEHNKMRELSEVGCFNYIDVCLHQGRGYKPLMDERSPIKDGEMVAQAAQDVVDQAVKDWEQGKCLAELFSHKDWEWILDPDLRALSPELL